MLLARQKGPVVRNITLPWSSVYLNWSRVDSLAPAMIDAPKELTYAPLTTKDIESVQRFVFFVGYARSGHSIVASLMDAHPEMVIAHEYDIFHPRYKGSGAIHLNRRLLYNSLYRNSYDSALYGWRNPMKSKKGYTLEVRKSWQGSFRMLRVIGDKAGGKSFLVYNTSRLGFLDIYHQIVEVVKVPVTLVHVVRNPYDMIATKTLYAASPTAIKLTNVSLEERYNNTELLDYEVRRMVWNANAIQGLLNDTRTTASVLEVHLADLVRDPKTTMLYVCRSLNVTCSEDYLQVCEHKVFREQPKTRGLLEWTQGYIEEVAEKMKHFSFFQRYSFDSD